MRSIARSALRGSTSTGSDVAHIVGLPLALAPVLRRAGMRVVSHVTLSDHVYAGRVEAAAAPPRRGGSSTAGSTPTPRPRGPS